MIRHNGGKRAPEPVDLPAPGKGDSTDKQEKTEKAVQLKRRSETEERRATSQEGKYCQWIGESEAGGVEASYKCVRDYAVQERKGCTRGKDHCSRE